jgi:phosphate starvation-inducible PhoH-like protein
LKARNNLLARESCSFDDVEIVRQIAGERNSNLKIIEKQLGVKLHLRGNQFTVEGLSHQVDVSLRLLEELSDVIRKGYPIYASDVIYASRILSENIDARLKDIFFDRIVVGSNRKAVTPKSPKQKEYIEAIRNYDVVFGIGPAGTGKTYLAMAMAVAALMKQEVRRIVLVRPAVEAGEKLGFLPGDLVEKVNPYLRPLYDALHDMMDFDDASRLIQKGVIEVAPLAFMRGRTLNEAFIILDEAQNTTREQMKMFLTRLGIGSRAVITGDITQIDLPDEKLSGLIEAIEILRDIEGICFVFFSHRDVVRHRLVQDIIMAYERTSSSSGGGKK